MDTEPTPPAMISLVKTLARIKDILAGMPSSDASNPPFYTYIPNPCLTTANLTAWEMDNGISLPEAYRLFLLEIGNGGTLPCEYSQFDFWPLTPRRVRENLQKPVPITRERLAQRMTIPLRERNSSDAYLFPELRHYYADEDILPGCMFVARYPSWESIILVVTGELRGTVWNVIEWENPEVDRQNQPFDFLGWFEDVLRDVT